MRQIPYSKFTCFERTVEALYRSVVPKPRSECAKAEQLVVRFVRVIFLASTCIASNPADSAVSVLDNEKGSIPLRFSRDLDLDVCGRGSLPA